MGFMLLVVAPVIWMANRVTRRIRVRRESYGLSTAVWVCTVISGMVVFGGAVVALGVAMGGDNERPTRTFHVRNDASEPVFLVYPEFGRSAEMQLSDHDSVISLLPGDTHYSLLTSHYDPDEPEGCFRSLPPMIAMGQQPMATAGTGERPLASQLTVFATWDDECFEAHDVWFRWTAGGLEGPGESWEFPMLGKIVLWLGGIFVFVLGLGHLHDVLYWRQQAKEQGHEESSTVA